MKGSDDPCLVLASGTEQSGWVSIWSTEHGLKGSLNRRRTKTEANAVRGTEFIQFLAALAILYLDNFEEYVG